MKSFKLEELKAPEKFVAAVHECGQSSSVCDGEDECLVVMSPAVFERILFETEELNQADRARPIF